MAVSAKAGQFEPVPPQDEEGEFLERIRGYIVNPMQEALLLRGANLDLDLDLGGCCVVVRLQGFDATMPVCVVGLLGRLLRTNLLNSARRTRAEASSMASTSRPVWVSRNRPRLGMSSMPASLHYDLAQSTPSPGRV